MQGSLEINRVLSFLLLSKERKNETITTNATWRNRGGLLLVTYGSLSSSGSSEADGTLSLRLVRSRVLVGESTGRRRGVPVMEWSVPIAEVIRVSWVRSDCTGMRAQV